MPAEEFVSEAISPHPGTADTAAMARGEPGLPTGFRWRGRDYLVAELLESWKTNNDGHGGGDANKYLRRHWFRIRTTTGEIMTLYCLRHAPSRGRGSRRTGGCTA